MEDVGSSMDNGGLLAASGGPQGVQGLQLQLLQAMFKRPGRKASTADQEGLDCRVSSLDMRDRCTGLLSVFLSRVSLLGAEAVVLIMSVHSMFVHMLRGMYG